MANKSWHGRKEFFVCFTYNLTILKFLDPLPPQDEWENSLRMISRHRGERLAQAEQENRLQNDRQRHRTLPLLEQNIIA